MKRIFDILSSFIGIIICLPLFIIISMLIIVFSGFPVFYKQIRIGKNKREFYLFKFRTMYKDSLSRGFLTVGRHDTRITKVGYFLRKFKLDELPQFFNVLIGDMSIVGPRPETPNYVQLYDEEQAKVLLIRPGITDYASIEYIDENEILAKYENPTEAYIKFIMSAKLKLNLKYISERNMVTDLKIIFKTLFRILKYKNSKEL